MNALIGFSGFVGSTLLKQTSFDCQYRSTNIKEIHGREFDLVVCAGAPAQKWIANREPEADLIQIENLISHLKKIKCKKFILISTVDVFKKPICIDEYTIVNEDDLHPYGKHRRYLEKFVQEYFVDHLVVRLPGLVGPGLRKNVIFDFLNNNNIDVIESRNVFQFYPMVNLWYDIKIALKAKLNLIHLTAAPISVSELSIQGFGRPFELKFDSVPVCYDMRTRYSSLYGLSGYYQYSIRDTIQAIRSYAQSEPVTLLNKKEGAA